MPELPDLTVYVDALQTRLVGQAIERVRLASPFLVRSVDPPLQAIENHVVADVRRLGKQLVIALEDNLFVVVHLMIAGRFHWKKHGTVVPGRVGLAAFDLPHGTLLLTEASSKKRAALHCVRGAAALAAEVDGAGSLELRDQTPLSPQGRGESHPCQAASGTVSLRRLDAFQRFAGGFTNHFGFLVIDDEAQDRFSRLGHAAETAQFLNGGQTHVDAVVEAANLPRYLTTSSLYLA